MDVLILIKIDSKAIYKNKDNVLIYKEQKYEPCTLHWIIKYIHQVWIFARVQRLSSLVSWHNKLAGGEGEWYKIELFILFSTI